MNVLNFNTIALSVCCFLLIGGYATNQHKAGVALMFVGVLGLLAVIGVNIYFTLHGLPLRP
ncbi:MAG: hypothetical protein Q4F13_03085 [Pseudomonadota bacterium]|nr:hypothetical protein [Pseudomonadota bacterium]